MTTKSFFAAALCCMGLSFATEASANSWRVNYDSRANADFLDLNAAMADERVADGDTLYMDKGCTISTTQTISKAVTIIGPGYFIGENNADEAYFSNTLTLSANGIKITGLHTSSIILEASNLIIERCRVTGGIEANTKTSTDNISIRQCYIHNNSNLSCIDGYTKSTGWEIANNIIHNYYDSNNSDNYYTIKELKNAVIDHNSIYNHSYLYNTSYKSYGLYNVTSSTITNNIIYSYNYYYSTGGTDYSTIYNNGLSSNNIISHNVLSGNSLSDYPNNKTLGSNFGTVYKSWPTSTFKDTYFILAETSPAIGYAEDGSDCGPFAGAYPYVLCGYPLYVPRFESITVPSQPDENGKLNIHMVIKNQNK